MQGQQERIVLKKQKSLSQLNTLIFAYYYGNKYIRVSKDSIEICKMDAGNMEVQFSGIEATKTDLQKHFEEDKRPFEFLLALQQDEIVRIFFLKGQDHYMAEVNLASHIYQLSQICKNFVKVDTACMEKILKMERIGYRFIAGSQHLSAFFLLSPGQGKEPLLLRCKMSKDAMSFEEISLWRNQRNMEGKSLKNAFFSEKQLACIFSNGDLRIYSYQARSLSYDDKLFINKALTEDIRLTKSINNARHQLISSARKGEVYFFLFLIIDVRSRYVLIQYCNNNSFKSIDFCKYQLRNLFENEEKVEINIVRQAQNQSWLVLAQETRWMFLMAVQPDKSISKEIFEGAKDARFGAQSNRLYCFREDSLFDTEIDEQNLGKSSNKRMTSTQAPSSRPQNRAGLNQQVQKKPVSPIKMLNQVNIFSPKSPDIAMPLTQLIQKPLANNRLNSNLPQQAGIVASTVSDDQDEEQSGQKGPPVFPIPPSNNIISFNPAPVNAQPQGGLISFNPMPINSQPQGGLISFNPMPINAQAQGGLISFNPSSSNQPEIPAFGRNFSFGEEKQNKAPQPFVLNIKSNKKVLSSVSMARLADNSKKIKNFMQKTSQIMKDAKHHTQKVEPIIFEVKDMVQKFKKLKDIESKEKSKESIMTIEEQIKALKHRFQARFTQVTTMIDYCLHAFKTTKKKVQLNHEKKVMSKISEIKSRGERTKRECQQFIQRNMNQPIQTNT